MTANEKREIAKIAHSLRSGAGGNPIARHAAHRLIAMAGGEAEVAFPASMRDDTA
jgi:hypothetical protein